jgi:glycosyltransferase involved in cell wall biosynthesis
MKNKYLISKRRMRIVYASDAIFPYTIGGSELRNYHVLKRLAQNGHDVHIYGAKYWGWEDTFVQDGIQIHGIYPYLQLYKNGKRSKFSQLQYSLKLGWKLLFTKFDIVESPSFLFANCFVLRFVTWLKRKKLVLMWHQYLGDYSMGYLGKRVGTIVQFLEYMTTFMSQNNVVISHKVGRDLKKRHIFPYQKMSYIPNGVDLETIQKLSTKLTHSPMELKKKYDIIFVGRIHYQKNIPLFLDVIVQVKQIMPNIQVCMLGPIQIDDFFDQIQKRNLQNTIVHKEQTTDQTQVYHIYFESKILLLTSHLEGFPLTLLEANACGVPVISVKNKHTDFDNYLEDELTVSMDRVAIAKKVLHLLKSKKDYDKFVKQARAKAQEYDWTTTAKLTEEYYQKLL